MFGTSRGPKKYGADPDAFPHMCTTGSEFKNFLYTPLAKNL